MKRWGLALVLAAALGVACGGGSPPKEPSTPAEYAGASADADRPTPAAKTTTMDSAPPTTPTDGDPTAPQPRPNVPGTATGAAQPPAPVPPPSAGGLDSRRSWALATLGDSEHQIEASIKECATACKALASMERAAKTLCDLGAPDECSRAKARVDAAREKVKKSCGSCPNGPSVVPGAPIPSVP